MIAALLAPTGTLRVGVWTVPYFAAVHDGALVGIVPDLGQAMAQRAGVAVQLVAFANPAAMVDAFRQGALDATFLGVTAERAEAINFGPLVFEIATTYLVPPSSAAARIADIDRPGMRIAVPAPSAQEAYLKKTIAHATLLPVAPENPRAALALLAAGAADAFSHVAPMLAAVQGALPGARIIPGSYFNVPVAVGVPKGRAAAVADFARAFAEEAKTSGLVQRAIDRAGVTGIASARAGGP